MLIILQARLQQYVNCEFPDVQAGFRKGRGTRHQIANIHWIIEKAREVQKTSTSALLTTPKPLTVWITTNRGKFFRRWKYQTTLTASWEISMKDKPTVRTGHGTSDGFQIRKGVHQGCILSPCLFNLYAEFSSVSQLCLIICDPMDCSMPGFPVHHQLLELTQTHVHWVSDAIEPFHLLISSSVIPFSCLQSFPASGSFQISQFFASGGQSIGVSASASVLPMNIQDWFLLG